MSTLRGNPYKPATTICQNARPVSRAIFKSTGVVGAMTLVSRVLALVRDMQFARAFGAGSGMDVFIVAQMIPNLGRRMFAEGAFSQAFVPMFTATKTTGTPEEARDLMAVSYTHLTLPTIYSV